MLIHLNKHLRTKKIVFPLSVSRRTWITITLNYVLLIKSLVLDAAVLDSFLEDIYRFYIFHAGLLDGVVDEIKIFELGQECDDIWKYLYKTIFA